MDRNFIRTAMTPRERSEAYKKRQSLDRYPCGLMFGPAMAGFINVKTKDYYHSPELLAKLDIELFKKFNQDGAGLSITLHGIAEALGAEIAYPDYGIAYLNKPAISSLDDVSKLKPINPLKDGRIPTVLKGLAIDQKELGEFVDVGLSIAGPFSSAASVVGTKTLLKGALRRPDKVHELLEIVTESLLNIIDEASKLGVSFCIPDPVSSTTLISKGLYEKFSFPYVKRIQEKVISKTGSSAAIHICGKSKDLWDMVVETGCDCFSIDNIEDLTEAKKLIGDKVCLIGNVSPVDIMRYGTEEDVMKDAKKCIDKAWDSPNGFLLNTGCDLPTGTPVENMNAMLNAATIYNPFK